MRKAKKRRKANDSCLDESSESENEADGYFRGKQDLKYATLEWRDIKQTTLGRKIDEKIKMLLADRKHLQKRIDALVSHNRVALDRQAYEMTAKFNREFKDKLATHMHKFQLEAKMLRL